MPRRGGGSGRILPHQRDTNDATPVIGGNITLRNQHRAAIETTEGKDMEDKCRKDYLNQIRQIYEYLEDEYPEYYEAGTKVLTDEEKADQRMFHHRNERDLIYSGLNVKMVKAFLSTKKIEK